MDRPKREVNLKKLQFLGKQKAVAGTQNQIQGKRIEISKYFNSPNTAKCFDDIQKDDKSANIATASVLSLKESTQLLLDNRNSPVLLKSEITELPFIDEKELFQSKKRTNLTNFVFQNEKISAHLRTSSDDDFETPRKKVKCAPIPKKTKKSSSARSRSKKQPDIKSAFLRNEQLFSEITAQHCIAENFNPDEVQLALAISKSEAENSGILCEDEKNFDVVNILGSKNGSIEENGKVQDNIRNKLQKFGFRTAATEDYSAFTAAFLPAANRQVRAKNKWANKFTALTLRNSEFQLKKVKEKVKDILSKQLKAIPLTSDEGLLEDFLITSKALQELKAPKNYRVIKSEEDLTAFKLENYFVVELFPVSHLKADHLLKNWSAIPGRDLSPKRQSKQYRFLKMKMDNAFKDLEMYFLGVIKNPNEETLNEIKDKDKIKSSNSPITNSTQNYKALDELIELIRKEDAIKIKESSKTSDQNSSDRIQNAEIQSIGITIKNTSLVSTQRTRAASPDLFADTDDEDMNDLQVDDKNKKTDEYEQNILKSEVNLRVVDASPEIIDLSQTNSTPEFLNNETDKNMMSSPFKFISIPKKSPKNNNSSIKSPQKNISPIEILNKIEDVDINLFGGFVKNSISSNSIDFDCPKKSTIKDYNYKRSTSMTTTKSKSEFQLGRSTSFTQFTTSAESKKSHSFENRKRSNSFIQNPDNYDPLFKGSIINIDLTQNDDYDNEDVYDNVGVILSDDEINYSILKANSTMNAKKLDLPIETHDLTLSSNSNNSVEHLPFEEYSFGSIKTNEDKCSFVDFIDDQKSFKETVTKTKLSLSSLNFDNDMEPLDNELLVSPYKFDDNNSCLQSIKTPKTKTMAEIFRERAEFGILDTYSEPYTQSPLKTPTSKNINVTGKLDNHFNEDVDDVWTDQSFLIKSPSELAEPMKRYSRNSNRNKFNDLLHAISTNPNPIDNEDDDFDEFDRLLYDSPKPKSIKDNVPSGLDKLLTAEISFQEPSSITNINVVKNNEEMKQPLTLAPKEARNTFESKNGKIYTVMTTRSPKPDFTQLTEAEILKQLYNFGIKPLKRKQAVKILEYIYNQMHPLVDLNQLETETGTGTDNGDSSQVKSNKLQDCNGVQMLRYSGALTPDLNTNEKLILQTNINKKMTRPLVPFHIAWHNLVCANQNLHESILMYEPIDLQEVYLFLKSLGYRYHPKDMKAFLDRRCIIFRYDLTTSEKRIEVNANRHIRKNKKTTNKNQRNKRY